MASHAEPREVRFYFDYISPNAYLAWTQLPTIARIPGVTIEHVPVLYAAMLNAHGLLGPAETAPKATWMFKNVVRKAVLLHVPINPPAFHPFNPLLALRVSSAPIEDSKRPLLIEALFRAVWVRGLHISEPEVVKRVADEAGLDGAALLESSQHPETKARLRAATDDAITRGVFGVPSMTVGEEVFWGYDDFPYLERFLSGTDSLDPKEWLRWSTRTASAVRPGSRPKGEGS